MELFGKTLYTNNAGDNSFLFWNGNLSLPSEWNVQGLWFDTDEQPAALEHDARRLGDAAAGPQGIGNTTASTPNMAPQDIAALYNFPLRRAVRRDGHDRPDRAGHRQCGARRSKRRHVRSAAGELPAVDRPDAAPARCYVQGRDGQDYTSAIQASARSMSASSPPSIPTATSASTSARATTATPTPRSSRPCRAPSGTPRTTRASSPIRSATPRACRRIRPSTRPTGSSTSTPPCATRRCSPRWATAARATRSATA